MSKRFLINVFRIPLQYWSLDLFNEIGKECEEFISLAKAIFSRSRMDVTTLLILSFLIPVLENIKFLINGKVISLRIVENAIEVEMEEEEDDDVSR